MALNILFLLLINVIATLSIKNGSLTFVIDDTGSMYKEIENIRLGSKSIVDVILKSDATQIQDLVLVTFNDPDVKFRVHTKDRHEFEWHLNDIQVLGGDDCPEMALTGLEQGLQESQDGSLVFLFTDNGPKDDSVERIERIKSLCQEKETTVVFVVTPDKKCLLPGQSNLTSYYDIARSSSGQVLRLDNKDDVKKIMRYINNTVGGDTTLMTSKEISPLEWTNVPFEIDDQTQYAVASTSGSNVYFRLLDQNNVFIYDFEPLVWMDSVKVAKINKPGRYVARVISSSTASIVIFARTDFTFDPGFSVVPVKSFIDTEKQPYEGIETYLWISVNEPKHLIEINSAEILDMNERLVQTLLLKKKYNDVYATDLFLPPNSMFKIAVNGVVKTTRKNIKRIARVPVESKKLKTGPPKIITNKGNTDFTALVGDKVLRIPCVAFGFPIPSIKWFYKGKQIEKDNDYSIENGTLIIKKIMNETIRSYTCRAENDHGHDEKNHTVYIESTVDNNGSEKKYLLKNNNHTLECPLTISDTDSVRWFKNGHFYSEGRIIYIIDASSSDDANYTCRVSNDFDSTNGETIEVVVDTPPTLIKNGKVANMIIWKGGNDVINCGVNLFKPTVKIQWFRNGLAMKGKNSVDLNIVAWGNYTCKVSNYFGNVENNFYVTSTDCLIDMTSDSLKNIPLILNEKSELPNFKTNEHYIVVPQGTALKLFCDGFKEFPDKNNINAYCHKEDQYAVNDKHYAFSDFYCNAELKVQIKKSDDTCTGGNTKIIKIGYETEKFQEVLQTCYDTDKNVPVFTKHFIPNPKFEMYQDDVISNKTYIYGQNGTNVSQNEHLSDDPNCLYVNSPLTNVEDVSFGVAQSAILEKQDLNDVLVLSCNNSSNWKQVEESIRRFIAGNYEYAGFSVWSGASKYESINNLLVPRYLWKVVKTLDSTKSLAIITVNDLHYSESDRLCGKEDECNQSWISEVADWPTYCCQLSDFSKAFSIPSNVFVA